LPSQCTNGRDDITRRCSRRIALAFLPFEDRASVMCNVRGRAGKRARG
jgi:hypothetical protein